MAADVVSGYPLGKKRPEAVTTPSGLPLDNVTVESMRAGRLAWEDLRATPETLRRQAAVAEAVGRKALAENLERAAELAAIPSETILDVYTALRPHRSTEDELEAWAAKLEEAGAPLSAAFVREAAEVYARRGLLAGEHGRL
jgi:propanediol dehydratase small subunit